MQVQDVVLLARRWMNDIQPNYRWDNATLIAFYDDVALELQERTMFPTSRALLFSKANKGAYQCPDAFDITSAYINGMLYVPSDLQTLEGHQIQMYDATGMGTPTPDSIVPPGGTGQSMPQWTILPPQPSPNQNGTWGYPAPDAGPARSNQRGRFFWRGGYITFVPAPANDPPLDANNNPIPNICLDGVFAPPQVETLTEQSWFPRDFRKALAWGIVLMCRQSDDSQSSKEARSYAGEQKEAEIARLKSWAKNYQGDAADGPKVQTNRGAYARANHRNRGTGAYPA